MKNLESIEVLRGPYCDSIVNSGTKICAVNLTFMFNL